MAFTGGSGNKRILKSTGIGIFTAIGYFIRPTVVITSIAVVVISFLRNIENKDMLVSFFKRFCAGVAGLFIAIALVYLLPGMHHLAHDQTYPITRWISIGLEDNGTNSSYNSDYPENIKGKEERIAYDSDRIKESISQYNLFTFVKHIANKLYVNWCDGSSAMIVKLKSDINFSRWYYKLVSQRNDGWLIYCQVFRGTTYLLALFSLIKNFKRKLCKEDILYLDIFGAFIFYMIWEVKSDYNIPFLLMFFCIASDGMDWYEKIIPYKIQKHGKKIASVAVLCAVLTASVLFSCNKDIYTKKLFSLTEDVVAMNGIRPVNKIVKTGEKKIEVIQNVKAESPFNAIKIYCKKRKGKGTYTIRLYSVSGWKNTCVMEWKNISGDNIKSGQEKNSLLYDEFNEKGYLLFSCGSLFKQGEYILQISPDSRDDSIDWYYNPFADFSYYNGSMLWNGTEVNGELAVCFAKRTKETYY